MSGGQTQLQLRPRQDITPVCFSRQGPNISIYQLTAKSISQSVASCYEADMPIKWRFQNFFHFYFGRAGRESDCLPSFAATAAGAGQSMWSGRAGHLGDRMTRLIKGWPFAAGTPQSLRPAVPACLSDLGLASRGFMWQIMTNLAPASAPLLSPSSLVSSWHSVSPS